MKFKNIFFTLALLITISNANAADVGIGTMFANFQGSAEAIIRLIKTSSYVIGLFLVAGSIFKFTQLGQGQMTVKTPLMMFFSGIGIFALTGTVSIATQTLAMGNGPGSLLMPSAPGMNAAASAAMLGVLTFIRMVGYLAFVRGFLMLNQHGQGKEGTLGRGLTHIFGGVAAINVTITAKILGNTFAPGLTLPF